MGIDNIILSLDYDQLELVNVSTHVRASPESVSGMIVSEAASGSQQTLRQRKSVGDLDFALKSL